MLFSDKRKAVVGSLRSRIPSVEDLKTKTRKTMAFQKNPKMKPILNYADENRKAGRFTDVIIKIENENIPAHKVVLACYSKYFEGMFATEMSEKYQNTVEIEGFDCVAVKSIIDYFYAERIVIDSSNVVNVLAASDYLQVDDIKSFCFEFFESGLTVDSCLEVIAAYNFFKPQASLNQAYQYVSENLEKITLEENFKALSKDELRSVIRKLDPKIVSESNKYTAIMKWIKHDAETRRGELTELFQLIDLSEVEYEFLEDVIAKELLIKEDVTCLNAVLKWHISRSQEMSFGTSDSKILSIKSGNSGSIQEIMNLWGKCTTTYPQLPITGSLCAALALNHSIFFIGRKSSDSFRTSSPRVFRLDLLSSNLHWKEAAPLEDKKYKFAATVHKRRLVIAGGTQYNSLTNAVEIYEMKVNKWKRISPLNAAKINLALVSNGNCLFAIGGSDRNNKPLSDVERLNDMNGEWEVVAPMSVPRSSLAAVCCDGFVYAIGGSFPQKPDKSVEKYNPWKNEWSEVRSMNVARINASACVLQGKIIVVGGMAYADEREYLNRFLPAQKIDCYDAVTNTWTIIGDTSFSDTMERAFVVV